MTKIEVDYAVGWGDITSHMQIFGGMAADHLVEHLSQRG